MRLLVLPKTPLICCKTRINAFDREEREDVFPEFDGGATLPEEEEDAFFSSDLGFGSSGESADALDTSGS